MTNQLRHSLLFATMSLLVFIGIHFFLYSYVSTGPNLDLSFGWLELHRHGDSWTVEHFHFGGLLTVLLVSALLTWLLPKLVRRRMA
jgi:uncharacterized membrane protein